MTDENSNSGRRDFLKTTSTAIGGAIGAGFPAILSAQTLTNAIKIGLVGCGGRGSGAAAQALQADDYTKLTAVADIDQSQIDHCLGIAEAESEDRRPCEGRQGQSVSRGSMRTKKVIDSDVDVVLLATPPGFRPTHFAACIEASKNVFCEKPVSTDAPGMRWVLETAE